MKPTIIGIPHGTRLQAVVLCNNEIHAWVACKQRGPDYSKWQGTYLKIEYNGRVTRVTVDDNYDVDDEFVIKEKDK